MLLARDTTEKMWIAKYVLNEGTDYEDPVIDPNYIGNAVSFEDFAPENIFFRLALGNYNPDDPNDSNNISTTGAGDDMITEQIVDFDTVQDHIPQYREDLILVKRGQGQNPDSFDWSYYHPDMGLVLDLWDSPTNLTQRTEPYGNDWFLDEPNELKNLSIKVRASRSRQNPSDKFTLTGDFLATEADLQNGPLLIQVGPWQRIIDPNDLKGNRSIYTYRSCPRCPQGATSLKLDLSKGTFRLAVRKIDLTHMVEPVKVMLVVGDYHVSGIAQGRGYRAIPMIFARGYRDILRRDKYIYIFDGGGRHDSITIIGSIALDEGAVNMKNMETSIEWAGVEYTLSPGDFRSVGAAQEKFVYRDRSEELTVAKFNFQKGTFKIVIRKSNVSGPPQDLQILIEDPATDETIFDQEISVSLF